MKLSAALTLMGRLQPEPDGPDAVSLPEELLSIDYALVQNGDFGVQDIVDASKAFRFWHVEPLLDQAADLLDRGMRDRSTYDNLRSLYAKLLLDIMEFESTDAIHREEVDPPTPNPTPGAFEQDLILSSAQQAAYGKSRDL